MKLFYLYKFIRRTVWKIAAVTDKIRTTCAFWGNNLHHQGFTSIGVPFVSVGIGGKCVIGKKLQMNNGIKGNPIGCYQRCTIFVDRDAILEIGENLGMSQTAIVCHKHIKIGNNVMLGGGVCIYDTDFHSLDPDLRQDGETDKSHKVMKEVLIEDSVFIGAHSIVLKGVTIGKNSIVGAGSVVTKSIPPNQIWAGNPAKFIKNVHL